MRGKLQSFPGFFRTPRITPAHAGKTVKKTKSSTLASDHPRACGENISRCSATVSSSGSPPRMRGKHSRCAIPFGQARITPAHAGKTLRAKGKVATLADHPRACGENLALDRQRKRRYGSPPRMRGKPTHKHTPDKPRRITPAHAGKTSNGKACGQEKADHPRACGENC